MILCWGEGHGSAIHDHADSHCFMKMLDGELCEVRYAYPEDSSKSSVVSGSSSSSGNEEEEVEYSSSELEEVSRSCMYKNDVAYINGKKIL